MEVLLWSGNVKPQVIDACKSKGCLPTAFAVPDIRTKIFLNDVQGSLQKALQTDPLLKAQMMEAGASVVSDMAQLMAYWVGMANTEVLQISQNATLTQDAKTAQIQTILGRLPSNIEQTRMQILPKVQTAAMNKWKELCRTRSEYLKYQIQAGLTIATDIVKTTTTVVATIGTAGSTLVLGIMGIVSGVAGVIGEVYNLSKDAETVVGEVFNALLGTLSKTDRANTWGKMKTSAETIARKLAPTDLLIDSPVKCKELNERYGHKVEGLDVRSHDVAVNLNKALEKCDELEKTLKQEEQKRLNALAAASPRPDPAGRRGAVSLQNTPNQDIQDQQEALQKLTTVVEARIDEVHSLANRVELGKKRNKAYEGIIDELTSSEALDLAAGGSLSAELVHPLRTAAFGVRAGVDAAQCGARGVPGAGGQVWARSRRAVQGNVRESEGFLREGGPGINGAAGPYREDGQNATPLRQR